MKINMGKADRVIRVLIVAIIAALYFTGVINGTIALVLGVLGGIFLLTSIVSFCPIYAVFRLNSGPKKEQA